MKLKIRKTTPAEIVKEVEKISKKKDEFDLTVFCKIYKHQVKDIPWKKINDLFSFIKKKKIKVNYAIFALPDKEKLSQQANEENKKQAESNAGLAIISKFLMEDKQISQLEERVLFWIYYNVPNENIKNLAKEKIINGNKKILFYFVKKLNFRLDHDNGDMLTEGYIELRNMFAKYDPKTNWKFLSYAQWSIYQQIKKYICQSQNMIKLPLNVLNQIYKLNKYLETNAVADDSNLDKYAKENKISNKNMRLILQYRKSFGNCSSMDKIVSEKDNKKTEINQIIADNVVEGPDKLNKTQELLEIFDELLEKDEKDIIVKLFGIGCDKLTKKELMEQDQKYTIGYINKKINSAFTKLKAKKQDLAYLMED